MPPFGESGNILKTAVAASALLLALVLSEATLRILPSGLVADLDIYRKADGQLLLRPRIDRRHVTPLWDVGIRVNQDGFRDFERPPAPGEALVLGLGDSMAFGWGVELDETFYSRLEAAAPIRLVKAGVPGTGTLDHSRMLRSQLLGGQRLSLVLLAFFVGNDFSDVANGGASQHAVVDGLLTRPVPDITLLRRLAIRSRFLQLLRTAWFRLGAAATPQGRWDDRMREFAEVHLRHPPQRTEQAIRATLDALDDVAAQCEQAGIPLLLVVLPRSYQVQEQERGEMLQGLGWQREDLDLDRPQRLLAEWAARRGVASVDVLPAFRAHIARGEAPLFFTPDAHMTPEGHRLTAAQTRPALDLLLSVGATE